MYTVTNISLLREQVIFFIRNNGLLKFLYRIMNMTRLFCNRKEVYCFDIF